MLRKCSVALIVLTFTVIATCALAQAPSVSLTPQQQAQLDRWRASREQWNRNHKHVVQLRQSMRAISEMMGDPQLKLNKTQATKVLGVIKKWETKKVLTDDQAGVVNKAIWDGLRKDQIMKIATMPKGRGEGGRGGGGGGGGGGREGAPRTFDITKLPAPRDYNPLNPDSLPMTGMREGAKRRMADLKAALKAAK